jgi:regulator of nonsense transcripts 2
MMSESLDSRKFERKSMFDVPLPIRKVQRDKTEALDDDEETAEVEAAPLNTMAFSLMTKKGNRQQVRHGFRLLAQCAKGSGVFAY